MESKLGFQSKRCFVPAGTTGTTRVVVTSSHELLNCESLGIHGGHGSRFDHVRRWGDNSALLYREVPRSVPPAPRVFAVQVGQVRHCRVLREEWQGRRLQYAAGHLNYSGSSLASITPTCGGSGLSAFLGMMRRSGSTGV